LFNTDYVNKFFMTINL